MAVVNFLMQGLSKESNHHKNLVELIKMDGAEEIILSSAFLTSDGVFLLKDILKKNKDKITVFVGCRNGITSIQGINSLIELGINPYVVDTGSSSFIFHPKVFTSIGKSKALSTVGSANLTYGGLVNNIETSALINLDTDLEEDRKYIKELRGAFEKIKSDHPLNVFAVDSLESSNQLFQEGRLVDEEVSRRQVQGENKKGQQVAPKMVINQRHVQLPRKVKKKVAHTTTETETKQDTLLVQGKGLTLRKVWKSKKLTARDLNIKGRRGTNATGSMLLKKGQFSIDQQSYFHDEVFKDLDWYFRDDKPNYFHYAKAKFYFVIEGIDFGMHELEIKHDLRTDTATYNQSQPMTHLSWGNAKSLVSNPNLLGKELNLFSVQESPEEFLIEINDFNK